MWSYGFLRLLPKSIFSRIFGKIARWKLYPSWQKKLNLWATRIMKIDLSEALLSIENFASLEELFIRELKPSLRGPKGKLCSPADSLLLNSFPVKEGQIFQAKGLTYSAEELLGNTLLPGDRLAWSQTYYLAPHNYHRIHSPLSGVIHKISYIPGELWPVHQWFQDNFGQLFCRNERMVFRIHSSQGTLFLVMVGALNVGRISTPFCPNFYSNTSNTTLRSWQLSCPISLGEQLGIFHLGSTVILVADEIFHKNFQWKNFSLPFPIQWGESLVEGET